MTVDGRVLEAMTFVSWRKPLALPSQWHVDEGRIITRSNGVHWLINIEPYPVSDTTTTDELVLTTTTNLAKWVLSTLRLACVLSYNRDEPHESHFIYIWRWPFSWSALLLVLSAIACTGLSVPAMYPSIDYVFIFNFTTRL